ncbi:hypothetical protein DFP74_2559 [Nocardiopsis sp. Huas11]|uniref:hypothetical protein n=1 Tax=Nocardiopsis sp. Huas11 TaxID=2183912 RepID=UPI000EAB7BEC|nr:hypothetical protein [Nocardiopsis sp. Huas11]RKS06909.1 hypothetical protein DFP74_2559 [Nocardiopsis sp. Huas11]
MIAVLLPPRLGAPESLPDLPERLPEHGVSAVRIGGGADDRPPYAGRYVAHASLEISAAVAADARIALVAEGEAGPLLAAVGAAQRAAHRPVLAYVLVDAFLPQPGGSTLAEITAAQSPARTGGAEEEPEGAEPGVGPLGEDEPPGYRTEHLPMASDWPDAPCGYLLTRPDRAHVAHVARMRGWAVREADPEDAPAVLAGLLTELRGI